MSIPLVRTGPAAKGFRNTMGNVGTSLSVNNAGQYTSYVHRDARAATSLFFWYDYLFALWLKKSRQRLSSLRV